MVLVYARQLMTNIALTALSSDIIKTYVGLGLGVGLVAESAIDRDDHQLKVIDASHLFEPGSTYICIHRGKHLRDYVYKLIEYLEPKLTRDVVENAINRTSEIDN